MRDIRGPWKIQTDPTYQRLSVVLDADGREVETVAGWINPLELQRLKLIAAAPELYESASGLYDAISELDLENYPAQRLKDLEKAMHAFYLASKKVEE